MTHAHRWSRRSRSGQASIVVSFLFCVSPALAEPARPAELVILLQPTIASLGTRRSLARIKDELSADRFWVVVADSSMAGDPASVMENAPRDLGAVAIVAMFGDPETGQSELWVVERARSRTAVRRAMVVVEDPGRMPEVLSIRALELLRATALELSVDTDRPPNLPPPPPEIRQTLPPSPLSVSSPATAKGDVVAVETGLALLHSLAGPPAAIAPIGRIRLRLTSWMHARATILGLGSRPRIDTTYGSASVTQNIGLLELGAVFRRDKLVRPTVSVGAGALNVSVAGTGKAPYEGKDPGQWSAAFDAGLGATLALASRLALTTEFHAFFASPHPVVRFLGMPTATIAYPSLVLTLTLQVTL